jgi:exodeoxyribonuclease VII small subunit
VTTVSPDPSPDPGAGAAAVADPTSLTFDQALAEFQGVVLALETGGTPLEASISLYERGVALHARCAALLADAELRVSRLVERAGGAIEALELPPGDDADPTAPG